MGFKSDSGWVMAVLAILIVKIWRDGEFKERFLRDAKTILEQV